MSDEFIVNDLNVVTSCFSGSNFKKPQILSALNQTFVPENSVIFKIEQPFNLPPSNQTSCEIDFINMKYAPQFNSLEMIYFIIQFPEIVAGNGTDMIGYCDIPAVNLIKSIKITFGSHTTETLNAFALNLALKEYFKEKYDYVAQNWLGGIKGPNQTISMCEKYRSPATNIEEKQNIIKNGFRCILPLPFHVFRNKNFKKKLCQQKLGLQLTINPLSMCIKNNSTFLMKPLEEHTFSLNIYCQGITSNEVIFNNMSHITTATTNETYIEPDEVYSIISDNKAFESINECKVLLNSHPTTQYCVQLSTSFFSKKDTYLGETTEMAIKTFWGAMLKSRILESDIGGLIMLNPEISNAPLEFTKSSKSNSSSSTPSNAFGNYLVKRRDDKSIIIEYTSNNCKYETLISFNIELAKFPASFCLDLFHYTVGKPEHFFLKPEYFSRVNFEFEEYDAYNNLHEENFNTFIIEGIYDVRNYYFSFFEKKILNQTPKKYVFKEVNFVQKSLIVNQNQIELAASMPVSLVVRRQPLSPVDIKSSISMCKPNWPFYNLEGTLPIKTNGYKIGNDEYPCETIEFEKRIKDRPQSIFTNCQMSTKFSFENSQMQTLGFGLPPAEIDLQLKTLELICENKEIDLHKNFFALNVVQVGLKHIKYSGNKLSFLTSDNYATLATEVLSSEIGENGRFSDFHVYKEVEQEDNSDLLSLVGRNKRKTEFDFPQKMKSIRSSVVNGSKDSLVAIYNKKR